MNDLTTSWVFCETNETSNINPNDKDTQEMLTNNQPTDKMETTSYDPYESGINGVLHILSSKRINLDKIKTENNIKRTSVEKPVYNLQNDSIFTSIKSQKKDEVKNNTMVEMLGILSDRQKKFIENSKNNNEFIANDNLFKKSKTIDLGDCEFDLDCVIKGNSDDSIDMVQNVKEKNKSFIEKILDY